MNQDLDKKDVNHWAKKFLGAWADLDPDAALLTLSKNIEYYESPFSPPCESWEKVKSLWEVVPNNQKNITYRYEVVMVEEGLGLIHWRLERTLLPSGERQKIDGVFLVKLNQDGLCTMFKQWRMVEG